MKINGSVKCLFEQSGTFRDAFRNLGYDAYDYDIDNCYNCTDYILDLFQEIRLAFMKAKSIFDEFTPDDLCLAFFPCTYFSVQNNLIFNGMFYGFKNREEREKIDTILLRLERRYIYHSILLKLLCVVNERNLRLILENPYNPGGYLFNGHNFPQPTFVEKSRRVRGDYYVKPTAFWFFNCEPTFGFSRFDVGEKRRIQDASRIVDGKPRAIFNSEMSPVYARNFICDKILGCPGQTDSPLLFQM